MSLSSRFLHVDELIRARHVQCRPHNHICGVAEAAAANSVAFPLRGVFVKHLDDGREVVAHPGQAVFFNAGEIYRVSHPRGGDDCFVLELAEPVLRELLATLDPRANEHPATPFRASHAVLSAPALLRQRLLWRNLREAPLALELEERALELIAAALSAAQTDSPRSVRARPALLSRRREQVRAIAVQLAVEPTRRWTLAELAQRVHGSPFHLARAFHGELGSSIHQYLLHVRLAHALVAVLDTDSALTAIALEAGFATPSHFTAAFRTRYGVTPSELRRNVRATDARELRRISTADMVDRI
jgi:AraC-type DNA-binding domain-containing proteins